MLMQRNYIRWIGYEAVGKFRNMYQTVLFDANINKTAEIGYIGYDAVERQTLFYIVNCANIRVKFQNLYFAAWVTSRFFQLL